MSLLRKISLVVLVGILSLSMSGLYGCKSVSQTKVLKIGVVGPETGGSAQLGQGQHQGVQLACDEINAANAAGGWKLEPYFEDDAGDPTQSASATNKLIQQSNVNVVIASINSSCTLADMVVTQRAGIPQITAGSTGASITEQGDKWIFRTAVNDELQANALVDYAVNTLGIKKASTLTASDSYGQSGATLLKAAAQKAGLNLVVTATYNAGDKDFKPQLLDMKGKGTEAIFLWGIYTEAAIIANQARTLGITGQLFGASGMAADQLIQLGQSGVEGMLLTQSFLPDSTDAKVNAFVAAYKQKYNQDPIPHAAQAYDSVYILADAVKRANSNAPQTLRDAIMNTSGLQLITGSPKFDAKGNDIGKNVLITEIKNGKFTLVKIVRSGQ